MLSLHVYYVSDPPKYHMSTKGADEMSQPCQECECHAPATHTARTVEDRNGDWEDVPLCEEHATDWPWSERYVRRVRPTG